MLSKSELKVQIARMLRDKQRGISIALFADLAGISKELLEKVFLFNTMPMSEVTQVRVNRAYERWKAGEVRVMKRRDQTRYVDLRREAKSPVIPVTRLRVGPNGITLRVGPSNRHDYSEPALFEALGRK